MSHYEYADPGFEPYDQLTPDRQAIYRRLRYEAGLDGSNLFDIMAAVDMSEGDRRAVAEALGGEGAGDQAVADREKYLRGEFQPYG